MKIDLKTMRWRLLTGVLSLVAAVAFTLPSAASSVNLSHRVAEIWPNALSEMADVIWPNDAELNLIDVIWPNAGVIGGTLTGSAGSQGDQNNQNDQGNQNSQN